MITDNDLAKPKEKPAFKVGEFVSIKQSLFRIYQIKKKKLILKSCSEKEVKELNRLIHEKNMKRINKQVGDK